MSTLKIDDAAARWLKQEMSLKDGDNVRIFVRMGGCESVKPGYSLGMMKDSPVNAALTHQIDSVTFYMEESNTWVLDGLDLHVRYNEKFDDIEFIVVQP
ncbi:HesB/YadR/YfhF family protein [Paenibacillus chartarius]|uniref:HesB/YadR/YfhF family protein n=1 Tax=Paenibacillus chartarius TaxID=747481 RepID=A0ABV6DHL2_9BACL